MSIKKHNLWMFIVLYGLCACKVQSVSSLSVDNSQAMPPPPSDMVPQGGFGFAAESQSKAAYCTPDGCFDASDNPIPKTDPQSSSEPQSNSVSIDPNTSRNFKAVTPIMDDSKKIFTPDNQQFYRPLDGLDGYFQNFDAKGNPTGYYWNKAGNEIFKFADPMKTGFGEDGKPYFDGNSQRFSMTQENGVWRGDQITPNGSKTGVFYQYGQARPVDNQTTSNHQNWQFRFGIDPIGVSQSYNAGGLSPEFMKLVQTESIYFDQNPYQVSDFNNLKTYKQTDMANFWMPIQTNSQGITRGHSSFQPSQNSAIPQLQEPPIVRQAIEKGLRIIYVANGFSCPPCDDVKRYLATPEGHATGISTKPANNLKGFRVPRLSPP
jgi:hypothetical protein